MSLPLWQDHEADRDAAVRAPVIDWAPAGHAATEATPQATGLRAWVGEFVNHRAQGKAARDPNAALRLHAERSPRAAPPVSTLNRS